MIGDKNEGLEFLAEEIKSLGNNLRFNLCIQLLNTSRLVDKYMVTLTRQLGQKRSRMQILYTLVIHGGMLRPSDISKMLFQSKQTVTQILKTLEKEHLVKRKSVGKDRRTRGVMITKKGLNLVKESLPTTLEIANSAMPQLDEAEIRACATFLKKVRKHLYPRLAF